MCRMVVLLFVLHSEKKIRSLFSSYPVSKLFGIAAVINWWIRCLWRRWRWKWRLRRNQPAPFNGPRSSCGLQLHRASGEATSGGQLQSEDQDEVKLLCRHAGQQIHPGLRILGQLFQVISLVNADQQAQKMIYFSFAQGVFYGHGQNISDRVRSLRRGDLPVSV